MKRVGTSGRRDRLSESVVKTLFAVSRNTCAFRDIDTGRGCEEKLTDPTWKRVKGEIAHIHGALPGSTRYDRRYTEVNGFANLIILCPNHHTQIDSLEPGKYPVDVLER